jgi:predicted nucleic-acid-binding protein
MTSGQESRFSMQLVVRDFLTANATITMTLPNYAGFFSGVSSGIVQIHSIRVQQEADKTGIAGNKTQLRTNLIALAMDVSRKAVAYATIVDNAVLLQEVNYTETELKRSADTILRDRCQVIYDRANANVAALAAYVVTAAILTDLLSALNAYTTAIPKPRLGITDKKLATEQLVFLLKGVDDNLAKIDVLVEIIRVTQANFYNEYKNVRKIIATGGGSLSVKGKITDAGSGVGLKGATVSFAADAASAKTATAGSGVAKVKKSADRGGFNIKSLAEGSYTVTIAKLGYKDAVVTVYVSNGELSVVDVALEKL